MVMLSVYCKKNPNMHRINLQQDYYKINLVVQNENDYITFYSFY